MKRKIKKIMEQWKKESGSCSACEFNFDKRGILRIYTSQPGLYIGRSGALINKYRGILKSQFSEFEDVEFE